MQENIEQGTLLMFYKIIKNSIFIYSLIFISILFYVYISLMIIVVFGLSGYASENFRLFIMTSIPVFLLSIFLIRKILKRKYVESIIIFLFIIFELFLVPYYIFHDDQAGKSNDFNTTINIMIHDYYSPIFGR
jgi:hypothetical protein